MIDENLTFDQSLHYVTIFRLRNKKFLIKNFVALYKENFIIIVKIKFNKSFLY